MYDTTRCHKQKTRIQIFIAVHTPELLSIVTLRRILENGNIRMCPAILLYEVRKAYSQKIS
jgi:hypothetical protein